MKRRDFLTKGTAVAGLVSSAKLVPPLMADQSGAPKPAPAAAKAPAQQEIRSAEYLQRAQQDKYLPKPAVVRESSGPVHISPMPLAERVRRNIVPRRGFCSIAPASDALLISGNGPMSIEMPCDPYSEQVLFRHESLFAPHKRPFEAPRIANVFAQVRQMLLDGKYHDAARLGYEEWHKSPMNAGMGGFGGGPGFSMRLDYPKTASVKDYLRTVDFESTELKVHWTDERGEWVRRTFASRPDNLVVQWLTAPKGQPLNVRIALQRSAEGSRGRDVGRPPRRRAAEGAPSGQQRPPGL